MNKSFRRAVLAVVAVLVCGCGEGGTFGPFGAGGTSVKLQFANATVGKQGAGLSGQLQQGLVENQAPTQFGVKLIAVYLSEGTDAQGANVGRTSMIYLNPECQDDIMHCDVSGGVAEDNQPISKIISSFFDFSQPTVQVNQALNAQGRTIEPGAYTMARIEFCKLNANHEPNFQWATAAAGVRTFAQNHCTVNSAYFDPPLQISDGDAVQVTLAYDYSQSVQVGEEAQGNDCTGSGAQRTCFRVPEFVPSAAKLPTP